MLSMSQSDVTFTMRHIALMHESCHTYEWVMSHIRMSHVTHTNESCHTYEWVMSHIWMSHVTHTNESSPTYEWAMSHIRMSHVTRMNESYHTYEWVISDIRMSHVTHVSESCHTYEWVMSHAYLSHITHPPDPINYSCSLTGVCISQKHFTYRSVQIWKCCSKDFTLQDLILRTRFCDTGFIPHNCWVVDFHLTKMVRQKWFVPGLYQLQKGKSAELALKYFYMIHSVGRMTHSSWRDSFEWRGWPLNIFTWFIVSGGWMSHDTRMEES